LILEQIKGNNAVPKADVLLCSTSNDYLKYTMEISSLIRNNCSNIVCISDVNRRSLKAQLREANRLNVKYAVIIGDSEVENNSVTIKFMQDEREQITIGKDKLMDYIEIKL
jgi:histidyl-tRNA synthetase